MIRQLKDFDGLFSEAKPNSAKPDTSFLEAVNLLKSKHADLLKQRSTIETQIDYLKKTLGNLDLDLKRVSKALAALDDGTVAVPNPPKPSSGGCQRSCRLSGVRQATNQAA